MTHPNKTLLEALERIDAALEQTSLLNGVPYHPVKTVDEIRLDVPNVVGQINAFILLLNAYPAIRTALTAAGEKAMLKAAPAQPASDVRERVVQIIMRSFSSMPSTPTWQDREKATYEIADAILLDACSSGLKGGEGDDR